MWTRIGELKRELSDKEQALSKAHREKEELKKYHEEDLEARLQTYTCQQRQMSIPCRSCSALRKPVRACTCASGSPISTGDISTKVVKDLQIKHICSSTLT